MIKWDPLLHRVCDIFLWCDRQRESPVGCYGLYDVQLVMASFENSVLCGLCCIRKWPWNICIGLKHLSCPICGIFAYIMRICVWVILGVHLSLAGGVHTEHSCVLPAAGVCPIGFRGLFVCLRNACVHQWWLRLEVFMAIKMFCLGAVLGLFLKWGFSDFKVLTAPLNGFVF